ncbi:Beta-amylase [Hexamita inflata]|uniref:Beta-amylase n=1 Tax=Hexamita inflata TaxID=28002 RepID=A0AA86N6P1_9EUKA|nr:Beta-amylase [Hexamita inflata]
MINLVIALLINVNVMMPADTIQNAGQIKDLPQTTALLQQLKTANVNGIMIAVWWGIAEPEPSQYNFDGYLQLFQLVSTFGLKVIPIMSFHGSDVVSIPSWALSIAKSHGVLYKDQFGNTQTSYISLSADQIALFPSNTAYKRSPLTIYTDFMTKFAHSAFSFIQQNVIQEIQIGLGPDGELKYPSNSQNWKFPGIGAFQSFDDLFVEQLQKADIFGLKIDYLHWTLVTTTQGRMKPSSSNSGSKAQKESSSLNSTKINSYSTRQTQQLDTTILFKTGSTHMKRQSKLSMGFKQKYQDQNLRTHNSANLNAKAIQKT